ncbi:mannose-1-phosphate guanylyltransferase/mannose-6-phosphate isomerase [Sphingobium sp. IP1]|uniref:mannose-1-phosphate guanylyltransferase/mannose-6-phosphate isomerase n=1 Tax=Sphingobium sp. IP1 TaxID=2021637 RepID=UPI000C07397E|nr:mannose-1-phosphate guanylyltransferase/mannose-6-phosphate isomerase [Sphingobium sp. IP1]PHP17556.1 mannose-1-phosphate guanylyltransferase/mannose-6-phosphate isomerase [Sphingobium sp. IP1]
MSEADTQLRQITPVILAGGSGTRLWPLSRKSYPKQFVPLLGEETLFRSAVRRLSGKTGRVAFSRPVVLTNASFRFIVAEQLAQETAEAGAIIIEPSARNTAPAILAAALLLAEDDPDAFMLVAPSDQVLSDVPDFHAAVERGLAAAEAGDLVTFGILPTRPETGYGYLKVITEPDGSGSPIKLARFVEKPDADRAAEMLASGDHFWNAGIFLFAARDLITAFENHAPDVLAAVRPAVAQAEMDLGFVRLAPVPWDAAPDISIDYAVMERASNLSVVPYGSGWSDLGGWDAVWNHTGPDASGVATSGQATAIDCQDTLLRSDSDGLELVGIGLSGVIAIAMNDAVLIADKSRAQDVKLAVDTLRRKGAAQAESFPKDHRPWGWVENLIAGDRFQVKRITVQPGQTLSLQSHFHRSEHWIVVEGTARVIVDDTESLLTENQSLYVPAGSKHRVENPGRIPVVFIEVQTGAYLGEDDILRYEDRYARI